jgi:hypothetical protein
VAIKRDVLMTEKENGCEKTRLKIKKKWNSYLKENKGKEVEKNHM